MSVLTYSRFILVKKLRYRYSKKNDIKHNTILNNIMWYSFPIVYPRWDSDLKSCLCEYDAIRSRRKRYRKYVRGMVDKYVPESQCLCLVTLTFSDDFISNKHSTLRQNVSRFLSSSCVDYIACVDYGSENGREHYHAICVVSKSNLVSINKRMHFAIPWSKGFEDVKVIDCTESFKVVNYALKSAVYALKGVTGSQAKVFHKQKPDYFPFDMF